MAEVWKDIPGYEGKYQASDQGRIRSIDRYVKCARGANRLMRGRVLKPAASKYDPHLSVVLGKGKPGSAVHKLVALAFLGPRPKGQDIRHLDGNPKNNSLENLAYGTRAENIYDVTRIGKAWRKLTADNVKDIRSRIALGEKGSAIARLYGVSQGSISAIKHGRSFQWLN